MPEHSSRASPPQGDPSHTRLSGPLRALLAACLLPFAYAFVAARGAGIEWFVPASAMPVEGWTRARNLALDVLGYLLFQVWPHAGPLVGFAYAETLPLGVALINIHHFIVDAFIWRLRKDPNYQVVARRPRLRRGAPRPPVERRRPSTGSPRR